MKRKYQKGSLNTRRDFIKKTGAAVVGTAFAMNFSIPRSAFALSSNTLKVGLIGCGGRGSGAAEQALMADKDVVLTAMADVFKDRLEESYANLLKDHKDKVKVDEKSKFLGFDSYKKVMESDVDVVILTTPPGFRPLHFEAAIAAGKHVFCEKPVAVDAPGLRKVLDASRKAKEKNLAVVSGLCWRYHNPKRETFSRILKGDIGTVQSVYSTYNTGELWSKPWQPGWSDLEKKMRNWLYYNWLSGDHLVEQAIHSIDMGSWALGDVKPISVAGTGGRQVRTEEIYGNIFDHFALVYEYEKGVKAFHFSRQQKDCARAYSCEAIGTKGSALIDVNRPGEWHEITGENPWKYRGEDNDMYQQEHDELFASIRNNKPLNDGERMVHSSTLAVMGRMAAYTGQVITYDDAFNSKESLGPDLSTYSWDMKFDGPPVAMPGKTKFI
jgi:myo-inositol 2-dehydrogenase/D-chiro-inositol 1-dehydrogenase